MHVEDFFSQRIFQVFLNRPVQRPCAKLLVIAFVGKKLLRGLCQFQGEAKGRQTLQHSLHQDVDDLEDVFLIQAIEDDHIIDTVEEFWRESALQRLLDNSLVYLILTLKPCTGCKSHTYTKVLQLPCTNVRSHYDQ